MESKDANKDATNCFANYASGPGSGSAENLEEKQSSSPANKRIRFCVQYTNKENEVLREHETRGPGIEEETYDTGQDVVFEIVTTFRSSARQIESDSNNELFRMSTTPKQSMRILSSAIAHALRSVVSFYPTQDLTSNVIKINYPYAVLVHHYDELMSYREEIGSIPSGELCHRAKSAYEDLEILKEFLDEHIMPAVEEERATNRKGFTSFEWRWVDFRPGTLFIDREVTTDRTVTGVVHSLTGGSFESPSESWLIYYWSLEYDGRRVGRYLQSLKQSRSDGEIRKTARSIHLSTRPREEIVQKCIDKGRVYWDLLRKQCKGFQGQAREFPYHTIDGLVMVDMNEYYSEERTRIPDLMDDNVDNPTRISDCSCTICNFRRVKKVGTSNVLFKNLFPKVDTNVEDEQYFLLPRSIHAFDFKTRCWERLPTNGFREPKFEEKLIDELVMDDHRLKTLKALAKSFVRINESGEKMDQKHWSADFIKGKGNGLIFLLHGKPGVGKTCTAECIAAYTSRPLMVLTSSDIGSEPRQVEQNLTRHFKRATHWNAILLIDEADVFMERRSTADLSRNSLVAGFLRALEFYEGILFLTTNRVGFFDDAFISRIHVQLYYPDFDDVSRRKVWQTFIDKLERERGDYIRLNAIAKEYLDGSELKVVKWNGREIRNAFQTAVALAEYEAKKDSEGKILLTDEHLKSVVELSKDFKDYLDKLHLGDEG